MMHLQNPIHPSTFLFLLRKYLEQVLLSALQKLLKLKPNPLTLIFFVAMLLYFFIIYFSGHLPLKF